MKIGGYLKTSLNEWPGNVSAVIFTVGCNFRCPFCHNSQLVNCDERGLGDFSDESILKDLKNRKKWLDGVVITGGEPTLQPDLIDFLTKIKALGLKVMIETNGSNPVIITKLANSQIANFFAIDIKGPLDERYKEIIKLLNFQIANLKKTLGIIIKSKIDFELRTTVVPGIHDEKMLEKMARQISKLSNSQIANCVWQLQTFQPKNCLDPKFNKIKPYSLREMEKMLKIVRKIVLKTELR
jgi:pyruvate formate lyase activating enzyme